MLEIEVQTQPHAAAHCRFEEVEAKRQNTGQWETGKGHTNTSYLNMRCDEKLGLFKVRKEVHQYS